jgi:hypothetical protein
MGWTQSPLLNRIQLPNTATAPQSRPRQVGFPRREPERLKVALEHTHRLVWVRATKQTRVARMGQLLGFARATRWGRRRRGRRGAFFGGSARRPSSWGLQLLNIL